MPPRRWRSLRAEPERGGGTSLAWVIVMPAILLVIFTGVQAGLWFYGRVLALHAAQEAVLAGRVDPVSTARAQQRAQQFLDEAAGDWITAPTVDATTDGDTVRVTVTGRSLTIVPGLNLTFSQTAAGGVERPAP
ncbi:TadE/TadG family type IV pilus assembly protein [Kutzneria buriramensis]|uniref:TadE-like protein n=1 Tax=Kutzneria buriramensis TaxID=1045776 RepID=A0A3E0GW08_9PSEU|nr:TadE family protein [Kutzneria buriramensis]REH31047.1 TadE-like protein [Kutzneria buriramensis]